MRKLLLCFACLAAMLAASIGLNAQEVTITLIPGWTWISYPSTDTLDFATALGDFTPMQGDVIKSKWGTATFRSSGRWVGTISEFYPGYGYHYKSNRQVPVVLTMGTPLPQLSVTTVEPTDITTTSAVVGSTVTIGEGNQIYVRGVCWGTEEMPTKDGSHISGEAVVGSQSVTLEGLTPGTTYYVRAYMVTDYGLAYGNQQSFTTEHEFVDLGLPSGTLWAMCNVGANAPEDYGSYFSWAETQPKSNYKWSSYIYCCNGTNTSLTKYCYDANYGCDGFTDDLTILQAGDDAATANWGDGARIPTNDEWQELIDNTTYTWINLNNIYGCLFTASNGNSIFLPAAGYLWGNNMPGGVGLAARYWTSSLDPDLSDYASGTELCSNVYSVYYYSRAYGLSVRPVRSGPRNFIIDAIANPSEGGEVSGGGSYQEGAECTLTAMANSGYTFTNWTENGEVVSTEETYSFTVTGNRTLVANFTQNGGSGDHAYVDLGLPSGLLWATCNVGAENPEDYGDYFAWGETQPKDTYNWSTYQYCNGSSNTLTKYCNDSEYGYNGFTDNLTTLLPEDDAATANWGNDWRMPTKEEWQELIDNTTVTWATLDDFVDVAIYTASNGNSLILPVAGYSDDMSESNGFISDGSFSVCWSSSLYTDFPDNAWIIDFGDGLYEDDRYIGHTVRAVRSSGQNNAPTGAINGKFTINEDGDQIYFSQGNLQYQASTNAWRFADNQFDFIGGANTNISSSYNGWIDLFGWGTSGYHNVYDSFNVNYQPYSASAYIVNNECNYYGFGPSTNMYDPNLTGTSAEYDWGIHNAIDNGGDRSGVWRTLTDDEWAYLFFTRSSSTVNNMPNARFIKAKVNDVGGVILFPDVFSVPEFLPAPLQINNVDASFNSNSYSIEAWNIMESMGCVFLPAAGFRDKDLQVYNVVYNVGECGYYWSTTYVSNRNAHVWFFGNIYGIESSDKYRYVGASVRLVCDVE